MPKPTEPRKGKKKNESLALLRAITKSMAGAIPGASPEIRNLVDDSLARPISGFASQFVGEDTDHPGEVVFPPWDNLKKSWRADERRKAGLPREKRAMPGMVQDTLSLPSIFGGGPKWAMEASESADRIHGAVNEDMGLQPAQGFRQHGLESLGMMGAQIPVAGGAKKKVQMTKGALELLKKYSKQAAMSPFEFFLPTIDPRVSNYVTGAVAGGGLGTLGDDVADEIPIPHAVSRAKGGKVSRMRTLLELYSRDYPKLSPADKRKYTTLIRQEAKDRGLESSMDVQYEIDRIYEDTVSEGSRAIKHAKGGKVGALTQILKAVNLNPDSTKVKRVPYQIGDPVEEILYATNEGHRKGVLTSDEARRIKDLLVSGEEEELSNTLLDLHSRLFPSPPELRKIEHAPPPVKPDSELVPAAHGSLTQADWESQVMGTKKSRGGKINSASNSKSLCQLRSN